MKLVKGRTLAALLDERPDVSHDRGRFVAIFEHICQAIGYAHAHRVLHRDLKPQNVMVGAFGEVQVMDWGLAKVLSPGGAPTRREEAPFAETVAQLTAIDTPLELGSVTRTGQVVGTPGYIPPEQAGGEIHQVDARSDVFGLGAILCVILTGAPPYRGANLNAVRLMAVRGELADALARLDASGAEPELVALCKRCLAFDKNERLADGGELARAVAGIRAAAEERARQAELERTAALFREAEQHKRRRVWLGLAASLLMGLVASSALALWAEHSRRGAELARKDAEIAQHAEAGRAETERRAKLEARAAVEAERQARQKEQRERKYAQAIADFVRDDFLALTSVEGQTRFGADEGQAGLNKDTTLGKLLDRAAAKLSHRKDLDPRIEAELRWIIGVSYRARGDALRAIAQLERCVSLRRQLFGQDDAHTLHAQTSLALAYHDAGKLDLALPLYDQTLKLRKARLGADHPDTLWSMNNLACAYQHDGKIERALALHEETFKLRKAKLGADHPDALTSMNNLAIAYRAAGKSEQALPLFEETLNRSKAKLGVDHPRTLASMNNLAHAYRDAGKLERALPLLEETLKLVRATLEADHPSTLLSMNNLAVAYQAAGKLEPALPLYEEALKRQTAKLGADHPDTLLTMNNLASANRDAGKLQRAIDLFQRAAAGTEKRRSQHQFSM
ncbi:MAG: tetratricopeptide repeat protein, partial [Pirellulales bacterium]